MKIDEVRYLTFETGKGSQKEINDSINSSIEAMNKLGYECVDICTSRTDWNVSVILSYQKGRLHGN